MTRVAIAGISGRMGRTVAPLVVADPELTLVAGVVRPGSGITPESLRDVVGAEWDGRIVDHPDALPDDVEVVIDFTTPVITVEGARAAAAAGRAFVSGTTGLTAEQLAELRELGQQIPLLHAPSFSVGISALLTILPDLVGALAGFDLEIVETHHRGKVDAPSGTALALAQVLQGAQAADGGDPLIFGRHGEALRTDGEIAVHAVRGGGNPGEHTVLLAGDDEQITINHRSYSRRTYGVGAVEATRFVVGQQPGFYSMIDLVRHRIGRALDEGSRTQVSTA